MSGTAWRNPLSALVVLLSFLGLFAIAPNSHRPETELRCDASGVAAATFPTMNACVEEMRRLRNCGCLSVQNKWYDWYVFGALPAITTVVAFVLLGGALSRRLVWLNLAVALAVISEFVWALIQDPAAAMAMPLLPAFIAGFCAGTSLFFALLYYARNLVQHAPSAT